MAVDAGGGDPTFAARVADLAVRDRRGGPMRRIDVTRLLPDGGLAEDAVQRGKRGVTLLSRRQWLAVCDELGVELPWTTRRANILLETDAPTLGPLIGRRIRIGEATVHVLGETDPCAVMDRRHRGLRAALEPACRGGVYGRVIEGGAVRVGDHVDLIGDAGETVCA